MKLVICPQKASAEAGKYALLPPQASLTEGDAFSLYEKAAKALPADTDWNQVHDWLAMPLDQLPQQEVQAMLERLRESLDGVPPGGATMPGVQMAQADDYRDNGESRGVPPTRLCRPAVRPDTRLLGATMRVLGSLRCRRDLGWVSTSCKPQQSYSSS